MADITDLREGDEVHSGILYRRIFPHSFYYKAKDNPPRPTSVNFLPDSGPDPSVSMYRAAETTPSEVLEGHDGFGLLEIDAEKLWGLGKRVTYEPQYGIVPPTLPAD